MPVPAEHSGGCICGGIRYRVRGAPVIVAHCHCRNCQRGSGAGHATGAMFPADHFHLTGPVQEYELDSSQGTRVTRTFCPACGSPIFGRNDGSPDHVTITLGTLDDPDAYTPEVVIYTRSRPHWDAIAPDLESFDMQPGWTPDAED